MDATTTTRKATRYTLTTNGVQSGEPTTNRAKALSTARSYAEAADRRKAGDVIILATVATGKIIFTHTAETTTTTEETIMDATTGTRFGSAINATDAQNTRDTRRAASYACMYGDANTVTHLVRNGRGIDGLCAPCADNYGYPQYLVPVAVPVAPTGRVSVVDGETAVIRVNLSRKECGWCLSPAAHAITIDESDWTDYACTTCAQEWFAPHFPRTLTCEFPNLCNGSTDNVLSVRVIHSNGTETYALACASCRTEAHNAHATKATSTRMVLEFTTDHEHTTVASDSPFCPSVYTGCHHTMVQSEEGYGVACYEYATMNGTYPRYGN